MTRPRFNTALFFERKIALRFAAIFIFFLSVRSSIQAQTFTFQNGNISGCNLNIVSHGTDSQHYAPLMSDTLHICSPNGSAQMLSFDSLFIQAGDTLQIFDGQVNDSNLLAELYDGSVSPNNSYSTANCFILVFKSDATTEGSFGFSVSCTNPCAPVSGSFNIPGESRPALICPGSEIGFHYAGSSLSNTIASWDFGDGQVQPFQGPLCHHIYNDPGVYFAKLIVQNSGCPQQTIDSMQVWVSTLPNWSRFPNDTTLCITGELAAGPSDIANAVYAQDSLTHWLSIPFQNNIAAFSPRYGSGCDSSYWSGPGIANPDFGCDYVQIAFVDPGTYSFIYHVTNNFGCYFEDTLQVRYLALPAVSAGADVVIDCQPVVLAGGLLGVAPPSCSQAAGEYTYCYGNNDNYTTTYCPDVAGSSKMRITLHSGFIEAPYDILVIHDGSSVADPPISSGSWPLNGQIQEAAYTATNASGCLTLEIVSDFAVSCSDGGAAALHYSVDCTDGYDFEWNWSPAASLNHTDSAITTVLSASQNTTYQLTGWPRAYPECTASDQVQVIVASPLTIQMQDSAQACKGDSLLIAQPEISGGSAPYEYQWLLGGTTFDIGDSTFLPANLNDSLCLIVNDGCNHQARKCQFVSEFPEIDATFSSDVAVGCAPQQIVCTSDYTTYQNIETMYWQFGDGDTAMTMGSAAHIFWTPGSYQISLEIVDLHGCISSYTSPDSLTIHPSPIAGFTTDSPVTELPNTNFFLNNLSQAADSFLWIIDDLATSSVQSFNYKFPPDQTGDYSITLIAFNEYGCTDTSRLMVTIRDGLSVFIPNSFTPNGDGVNEVWKISAEGITIEKYHLEIFDKWGSLIFESDDPNTAWTGGTQSGDYYVADGSYPYRLLVQDNEEKIMHEFKGSILVIR